MILDKPFMASIVIRSSGSLRSSMPVTIADNTAVVCFFICSAVETSSEAIHIGTTSLEMTFIHMMESATYVLVGNAGHVTESTDAQHAYNYKQGLVNWRVYSNQYLPISLLYA